MAPAGTSRSVGAMAAWNTSAHSARTPLPEIGLNGTHPSSYAAAPLLDLRANSSKSLEHPAMIRASYIAFVLIGASVIDRIAFDGRFYYETKTAANNLAAHFDYKIKDFLRPIR